MTHDDSKYSGAPSSNRRAFNNALLKPTSVALIGASSNPNKNTARPLRFMQKHGFSGDIYPVNPSAMQIDGVKAWSSIDQLPGNVDHAFVMIESAGVSGVVEQCARKGIGIVTIYSDGFAEAGDEGIQRQQELRATARRLGVRVLGPNSIGLANVHSGAVISVNAAFEMDNLTAGDIGIISQSGSMMGSLMSRAAARGFGFSQLVSVGNESDISVGEVLDAMVDDDATGVILLFLETLRDVHTLSYALERACSAGKPVIAYKLGRSEQGDALSQSHTGAIAGNDAAMDAYFRAHGVIRVNMLETLFEIAPLASRYAHLRPKARRDTPARVAVITTTGGGAATVVDNLGLREFVAVAPPAPFISHMASRGLSIRQTPVIDLTLAASSEQYQDLLTEIMQTDWCDAVLCIAGSSAQFHPQYAVQPILNAVATAHGSSKPLVAFLSPEAQASLLLLQKNAIAAFRTPESCADALAAFFVPLGQRLPEQLPPVLLPDGCPVSGNLSEPEAMSVFGALGIDVVSSAMVQPHATDHSIEYPVVLKVVSRDILHKTDAGGVKVGIDSDESLAAALNAMADQVKTHCPQAAIDGYMVQKKEDRLIELMLGYRHDPLVGPTVMLGAGGITAELKPDFSLRLAPVSEPVAWEMIREVKHTQLIRGYRKLPQGDCQALARAIVAFSRLALIESQPVTEAEINPLFVRDDGVVAVDAVIRLHEISQT
ncbi:acyl-CoA synthetase [Advenella sp. S44]|uniref:acetate--CoA ligase family protein n=1 Tax=Advenella sp. S44 TaxID=1982755 RepID=UPI000C2A1E6C|nr:acetate--CoA ligase family protein [Advenella sp. S44]PJX27904.1 acyl-CoA synthetase [Advenella sp. S44]